jgi:hypothetical protein
MPVKTQTEILADLDKSAQAMVAVQKIAEEAGALLRETEPIAIPQTPASLIEPQRFDR